MTSSITDAMIEAGWAAVPNRLLNIDAAQLTAIYTAMRSMEAKPDPEGVREALREAKKVFQGISLEKTISMRARSAANQQVERIDDALTAKPSLEPTQEEEAIMLSSVCGKHFDGNCVACRSAKESNDHRVLSRKQSGGGNG